MASETTKDKNVIDFLSKWASERDDWAKLLLDKILKKETSLTNEERTLIIDYFKRDLGLKKSLPVLMIGYNLGTSKANNIKLISLADVNGVNKLASSQTLSFSKNFTIIYGQNGTGKSGYARILKSIGFCYDKENTILPNIFEREHSAPSACIEYSVNDEAPKKTKWDGHQIKEINSISIFDNKCVNISTDPNRDLLITPFGFKFFALIADELQEIKALITSEIESLRSRPQLTGSLNEETPQYDFIENLSDNMDSIKLEELSKYDEKEDDTKRKNYEEELAKLNVGLIKNEIRDLERTKSEINRIKAELEKASPFIEKNRISTFISQTEKLLEIETKANKGISEIASKHGIKLYESLEFQSFIKAAESYIKKLGIENYPNNTSTEKCIYCGQPLNDSSAKDLITKYRDVLNSNTDKEISLLKKKLSDESFKYSSLRYDLTVHLPIFGQDEKTKIPVQPKELLDIVSYLEELKESICRPANFNKELPKDVYINSPNNLLDKKLLLVDVNIKSLKEKLETIVPQSRELTNKINEIRDRKTLQLNREKLINYIGCLKTAKILDDGKSKLSPRSITEASKDAREELIEKGFTDRFNSELEYLKRSHLPINISFGANYGKPTLTQNIVESYAIREILSEGEQKAVSIAEFIAEIQMDGLNAPVIFDDPVNSLDHHIIDLLVKRLMNLSKERQVIVFTHSILLFNQAYYLSSQSPFKNDIKSVFLETTTDGSYTGIIQKDAVANNSIKSYITEINKIISSKKDVNIDDIKKCYGLLRAGIEALVEKAVFNNVVKRYQKNVAMTLFQGVQGNKIDTEKSHINDLFDRCCGFIYGHSNPEEIDTDPTIEDIKSDFKEFERIHKLFTP